MPDSGEITLSERFHSALQYASRLHEDQHRKNSSVPYVAHLLGVAALVLEAGGDEDQAIAALLHDAVEDQPDRVSLADLRRDFGERVEQIVRGCSDSFRKTTAEQKEDWPVRKKRYLAHLRSASADVLLVSAADKLHNARSILADWRAEGDRVFDRFRGGKQGTLWYYRALTDVYRSIPDGAPGFRRIVDELARVVGKIEQKAGKGADPCRG